MEETLTQYHEQHDVKYVLLVVVDGEVLAKQTSSISADDVAAGASIIDSYMQQHIIDDVNSAAEYAAESAAETQMEMERGN